MENSKKIDVPTFLMGRLKNLSPTEVFLAGSHFVHFLYFVYGMCYLALGVHLILQYPDINFVSLVFEIEETVQPYIPMSVLFLACGFALIAASSQFTMRESFVYNSVLIISRVTIYSVVGILTVVGMSILIDIHEIQLFKSPYLLGAMELYGLLLPIYVFFGVMVVFFGAIQKAQAIVKQADLPKV